MSKLKSNFNYHTLIFIVPIESLEMGCCSVDYCFFHVYKFRNESGIAGF